MIVLPICNMVGSTPLFPLRGEIVLVEKIVVQDKLNSKIWDSNNKLREEVKEAVLKIANAFVEELKFDLDVAQRRGVS